MKSTSLRAPPYPKPSLGFKQRSQQGVALVVVLLFLVAITGISVWTARQSMLAESIARNEMDQLAARQAAEAALRDAERDIDTAAQVIKQDNAACVRKTYEVSNLGYGFLKGGGDLVCTRGLCGGDLNAANVSDWDTNSTNEPWWPPGKGGVWKQQNNPIKEADCDSFVGGVPIGTFSGVPPIKGVSQQPEYLIEIFTRKNTRFNLEEQQVSGNGENPGLPTAMYRITARGFGYSTRTQVVLQSIFFP